MNSARGALLLFADADGATKFSDLDKLDKKMNEITSCKLCYITGFNFDVDIIRFDKNCLLCQLSFV